MDAINFYDPRQGEFCFLSNLHPRPLVFAGTKYDTPEHAFQVEKARSPRMKNWLKQAPTPELAAVAGDALTEEETVPDWANICVEAMSAIVRAKFDDAEDLKQRLLATGERKLAEDSPVDGEVARFWGEYQGRGENQLGKILMELRTAYRNEK
ncbi:NADAR family protein [Sodalis sp. dw_96]|uniref:NADAR family protein n=1 Tax=Sodalis sp. dw_96 TaxID=2719794 RepID=UPI001BD5B6A0|nr:NADAR family protein [Sodalis sp. dw_96]